VHVEILTGTENRRRPHPPAAEGARRQRKLWFLCALCLFAFLARNGSNLACAQAPDSTGGVEAVRSASAAPEEFDGGQAAFDSVSGRKPRRAPGAPSSGDLCTDPLPGIAVPNAPHGLFALTVAGTKVNQYILNQPEVCGGSLFVVWSALDKGGGQYNWSSLDTSIAAWTAVGKKANLIVWAVSDAVPNTSTPDYVLQAPGYESLTCSYLGATTSMPVFYVDPFKSYLKTFMQAVLNRYGANPNLGYIRFGLATGGEAFPPCLHELMSYSGFSTLAQFDAQWESYVTEMTQWQQTVQAEIPSSSGRPVRLMAALNWFGSPPQYSVCDFEAKNAVSLGFGFGSQGFSQSDIAAYQSGQPCTSDWCAMFRVYAGQVPLELQTAGQSDPTNAAAGVGSMTVLLPFALSLHTQLFEIYLKDLQIAYDPTSPDYGQYSQVYQQAYEKAAETLGFGSKP
jgi:hypothetical protein